ncbi:MAG TPA: hypothetical protein VM183_10610 [Burkholderiales bacterium]|nr:hypothetical protein [Burkholderiales bacterium]
MRALAAAAVLLAGCAMNDIHAPKTVTAGATGGAVTVNHGSRLRIPLTGNGENGLEWRRVEPPIMSVVAEGVPDAQGFMFTPVRTGTEKLRFEYRPMTGEGMAQRVVSYDITVR